ncbi:MAG TPA: carboxypeptidase-like regulatory domain-containing protein [Thermoanaerobaculia bacterium]|nr:carboxypeptidase-like regulatory domain-containing protein [Thermoanaerobaculia bacterium]
MTPQSVHRGLLLAVAAGLVPVFLLAVEVTFVLAPVEDFHGSGPAGGLAEGTIHLYRSGTYEPDAVFRANQPQVLPRGTWHWIAEAPGWVSVDSGVLVVGEEREGERTMFWPVVPACRLELEGDWRGAQRLDVASPAYGSVHPLRPGSRPALNAPADRRLVAYSVGNRGLIGISLLAGCVPGAELGLAPPRPPPADLQDLLMHVVVPEGVDPQQLAVRFRGRGGPPRDAAAVVWRGGRGSFFFLGLAAGEPGDLQLVHPQLRSVTRPIEPLGGSARELPEIELAPRRDLPVDIDYRPRRPHRRQVLQARHCGGGRSPVRQAMDSCPMVAELELRPGLHRYTFEDLDDGLHVLTAIVDDEVIHGLGASAFPYLDPEGSSDPTPARYTLVEEEIHGALLRGGEPVPGEVVLLPIDDGWPERRAATGDDLLYHLFYFGRRPFAHFRLPGGDDPAPREAAGLHYFYRLAACDDRGRCRHLHPDSILRGSGRLDLEIGAGGGVEVEVTDAATGEALEGATVRVPGPRRRLVFDRGEIEWLEDRPAATLRRTTGPAGRAAFAALEPGRLPIEAARDGYRTGGGWSLVEEGTWVERRIELDRHRGPGAGARFELPDGRPLEGGALLGYDPAGTLLPCSVRTGRDGRPSSLPPSCAAARRFLLVHPAAALQPVEAARVLTSARVELPPAPSPPLRLRVTDAHGAPVAGVAVELAFGDLVVGEVALLAALSASGGDLLFRRTDASGTLVLRAVDPAGREVPSLRVGVDGVDPIRLDGFAPGDTVTVVAERKSE